MSSFINQTLGFGFKFLIILISLQHIIITIATFAQIYFIGPEYTYCDIYIPSNFDKNEIKLIREATSEWEEKTNHIITYRTITHGEFFTPPNDRNHSVLLLKANSNSNVVKKIDERLSKNEPMMTLGFYDPSSFVPTIIFVPDRLIDDNLYRAVILHELGHSLGLDHDLQEGTVMYETINYGAYHITKNDLTSFCRIYFCNADNIVN